MSIEVSRYEYSFPFDTDKNPVRISQGNNGPWSHYLQRILHEGGVSERDLIHAVDFALPLGTEVKAARGGTVFGVILGGTWYYEGNDPEVGNNPPRGAYTNSVVIEHEDYTYGVYSHLGNREFVDFGDVVKEGQVIAVTGRSGWIADVPHLHFQVSDEGFTRTFPLRFKNYDGSLDHETLLREGKIWLG